MSLKYFSLFSGIGGFEIGINRKTEWQCIGYSEIDKYADAIYRYNFRNHKNFGDATRINTKQLPDFDILVAGFPCQSFSIAGKQQGFADTRGTLFFEIARICADKKPSYILLENVKGLLSNNDGSTFATILETLTEIGYILQYQILNSKDFGVPQSRERVFIVGYFGTRSFTEVLPIKEAISYDKETNGKSKTTRNRQRPMDIAHTINAGYDRLRLSHESYIWESNGKIRRLTPVECERLQGFPDNWTKIGLLNSNEIEISDTQRYKCIGNAVTTTVVEEIVGKLETNRRK